MMNILIAVDGSEYTSKATRYVALRPEWLQENSQLHLLHVEPPIPSNRARAVLGADVVDNYYREESEAALAPAEKILREKNIPFLASHVVGDIAEQIRDYVKKNGIDMIVMGSHGHGALQNLVMGSVATKVLASASVPVLIVR
jgi:nucleotide-binding universal stress UspA family protein